MTTELIGKYLEELRKALKESDRATIQDALSDAEDHLSSALENAKLESPESEESVLIEEIIESYGSPEEIADAYLGVESLIQPSLSAPNVKKEYKDPISKFFGIYTDPKAWGSTLYLLVSLLTGIAFFTWAVTGLSLSIGLAVLIFGVPFAALFLLSSRWIGLVEGRIVEALLGIRMPRRVKFFPKDMPWQEKLKSAFTNASTWKTILYMILQLPLGIVYFTGVVVLGAFGISFAIAPIVQKFLGIPMMIYMNGNVRYFGDGMIPIMVFLGILILTSTLHISKFVGGVHGNYAKKMLVGE